MGYMDYLKELCEDLNLNPDLEKTKEGLLILPFSSMKLEVKPLDPGVYIFSVIGTCPKKKREDLFIQLMKANLFGQGTLGSTIAFKPEENLLTLSLGMAYDMDYRTFREALEDFTNIIDYWRIEIEHHVKQAENSIL